MSVTVTISDQTSYIKIKTLGGTNSTQIQGALSEVCGEFTVDRSKICQWTKRFRGCCLSKENDSNQGSPRT